MSFLDFEPTDEEAKYLVCHGGRYAEIMADFGGWPAYVNDDGVYVMETLMVFQEAPRFGHYGEFAGAHAGSKFLPASYATTALLAPDGLTALHHDPEAWWCWRPCIYACEAHGDVQCLGSQRELEWRQGLHEATSARSEFMDTMFALADEMTEKGATEDEFMAEVLRRRAEFFEAQIDPERTTLTLSRANERAREILIEHLDFQQEIDLKSWGHFYVRGEINRLYEITPGNGFAIVDPVTREELVRFCLHPEEWIPDDDVCLATKLAIDAGLDGEKELMEAANPSMRRKTQRRTRELMHAKRLEDELGVY